MVALPRASDSGAGFGTGAAWPHGGRRGRRTAILVHEDAAQREILGHEF